MENGKWKMGKRGGAGKGRIVLIRGIAFGSGAQAGVPFEAQGKPVPRGGWLESQRYI
jgi:hypothetical protein